jgi:hypothetical protein
MRDVEAKSAVAQSSTRLLAAADHMTMRISPGRSPR